MELYCYGKELHMLNLVDHLAHLETARADLDRQVALGTLRRAAQLERNAAGTSVRRRLAARVRQTLT